MIYQLSSMKILFWFRKSEAVGKTESDPMGRIQCRIKIDTQSIEIGATPVSCKKSVWNSVDQVVVGNNFRATKYNKSLHEISTNLSRLFDVLCAKYDFVSPATVKEYYLSKRKFTYTVTEITDAFLLHREKMVLQESITQATVDVNRNYCRHIKDYCERLGIQKPVEMKDTFVSDLFDFMIDDERSGERFARKVCAFAKQILKWAVKKKMSPILACLAEDMPGKADSEDYLDTTHLSIFQLDRLFKFDFYGLVTQGLITQETAETLSEERDAFVFNCFTGMHHIDYCRKEFFIDDYRKSTFVKGKRKKTQKPFTIKLLEPAIVILKRYGNELKNLPIKSNQKRNGTLKQIAVFCGIPLLLTTKVARKTFCDLALNEMLMSADDVAACLGLTSTRHLKNYGRIREKRLIKIMKSWGTLIKAS